LTRSQGCILLGGLLLILTARFYVDERREEVQILQARGASNRQIHVLLLKEFLGLSVIAILLAIFAAIFVSRIAFASVNFLVFRPISLIDAPMLISAQTMTYAIGAAIIMPMIGYSASTLFENQNYRGEQDQGRLARLNRGLRLIRWDASLIILSVLFLAAIYLGGPAVQENPNLILIQHVLPYPLFAGVASLATKIMNRLGENLSSLFSKIKGEMALSIGGRRATKDIRVAGPVVMMLVLSMCVSINSAVVASSLPQTEINHTRFAIGGDINILLNDILEHRWEQLDNYTKSHSNYEAASFVNVGNMYLSDGRQGKITFVAIQPEEYSLVGYDHMGVSLNDSYITESLQDLETNPTGAIITENLAQEYELEIGDELHGFGLGDTETSAGFTIINIVPALSSPIILEDVRGRGNVGMSKIWLNVNRMAALINLLDNADTYYCIRSTTDTSSGQLLEDIIGQMGIEIAYMGRRSSVGTVIESYLGQTSYLTDRAVDSLMTLLTFPIAVGSILLFGASGNRRTRRQTGILKSMGAETTHLTIIHLTEVLVIAIISLVVFLIYGPLFLANSLERAYATHLIWPLVYPVLIFADPVWAFTIPVVFIFILTILAVSGLVYARSQEDSSFELLGSQWTKSIFQEGLG
jgi:predicted lysophospholipase L1 biosynthesis ABC-type transport system permease subunit